MSRVDGRGRNPNDKLAQFVAKAKSEADTKLRTAALLLRIKIVDELSKPGMGRLYKVRKGRTTAFKQGPLRPGQKRRGYSIVKSGVSGYVGKTVAFQGPVLPGKKALGTIGSRIQANQFHRASAPSAPPAPDTATLKRSAYVEQSGPHSYAIGVAAKYASYLNTGTARIKARPFMKPALEAFKKITGNLFVVK